MAVYSMTGYASAQQDASTQGSDADVLAFLQARIRG